MAGYWQCPYCGRDTFRKEYGYLNHLNTARGCKDRHIEAVSLQSSREQEDARQRAREILEQEDRGSSSRRVTRSKANRVRFATLFAHDNDADTVMIAGGEVEDNEAKEEQDDVTEEFDNAFDQAFDAEDDDSDDDHENPHDLHLVDHGDIDSDDEDGFGEDVLDGDEDSEAEDEMTVQDVGENRPDTEIRDRFVQFCDPRRFKAPLTPSEETGVRLMNVLRKKKAPMNAFNDVYEWHLREKGTIKHNQTTRDAGHHYVGRETLMKRLTKRYGMTDMAPRERTIRLPSSKEVIRIPVHQAKDCIQMLLTDPRITDDHYSWFNDDPLAPPPDDLDYIADCNTGKAFSDAYAELIDIDQPNQQLLGVIFYIDGAATGQFANLPVTILKMSLTCFTREARTKSYCWANLGYVPQVRVSEGRGKKIFKESEHLEAEDVNVFEGEGDDVEGDDESTDTEAEFTDIKAQDFHAILSVILESYVDLQATGMIFNPKYKGKEYKNVHFVFFTPMVKCDTEEGDMLCGKYKPRTKNIQHLCRYCHIPTERGDRYMAKYKYKTQTEIEKLVRRGDTDRLKQMSQHYLKNAWYKVRFSNERGIHGATPSDKLHAILLGIFKYVREIFFKMVGDSAAVAFDINGLGKVYGKLFSHQSDRSFGSTNFSKGIKEGKLMAKDYRGVLLNMAAILRSTKGRALLHTKRRFKEGSTKDDWLMLVETLLEWEAYLNQPKLLKKHLHRLKKKHRFIMYLLKRVAK